MVTSHVQDMPCAQHTAQQAIPHMFRLQGWRHTHPTSPGKHLSSTDSRITHLTAERPVARTDERSSQRASLGHDDTLLLTLSYLCRNHHYLWENSHVARLDFDRLAAIVWRHRAFALHVRGASNRNLKRDTCPPVTPLDLRSLDACSSRGGPGDACYTSRPLRR